MMQKQYTSQIALVALYPHNYNILFVLS